MKKFTIIFLLVLFSSQYIFAKNPPGTKKLKIETTTLYVDKQELSFIDYWEYLYYKSKIEKISEEDFRLLLPDTLIILEKYPMINGNMNFKFVNISVHPSFQNFSIVGISKQQAENYCTWRSEIVNQNPKYTNNQKELVKYTIPTEEQIKLLNQTKTFRKKQYKELDFPNSGFRCIAKIEKKK